MNIILLQTFLTIIKTGSLVKASKQLYITQSTVTARLHSLETEFGQRLLHRQKSGITLTPSGIKLQQYAQTMVNLWLQAKQVASLPKGLQSICNFGCHIDLWFGFGKPLFDAINASQPQIALSVMQGIEHNSKEWLNVDYADISLTYEAKASENQSVHHLAIDELILYSTKKNSPIRFDPLYIYVDQGRQFRHQHTATYADANVARITFDSITWALNYILENGGTAYLPKRLAQPYLLEKKLFVIKKAPSFKRNIYLITHDLTAGKWQWLPDIIKKISH